jgi:hypothetical protein
MTASAAFNASSLVVQTLDSGLLAHPAPTSRLTQQS